MNFIYGGLAIAASLFISDYLSKSKATTVRVAALAFTLQFLFVIAIGAVYFAFGWGFLAEMSELREAAKRIGGLALFLGVLVALRALNKRKRDALDSEH